MGTILSQAHLFHSERKKCLSKLDPDFINPQVVGWVSPSYCLYSSAYTRLFGPLQLPAGHCLFRSRWGSTGPVGEGDTDLRQQLAWLCCLLVKPGGERDTLSPPRDMNPPGGLTGGVGRAAK